ncbi:DUF4139 domain-containing protein [Candidatus Poribacteria bacterium]|nr:DUF4139 domain-containing protein [Candidatus Poribacteria bacterium]
MKNVMITLIILLILLPKSLPAQVQMVTRPDSEGVELTIYNSRDLTLVKEQRNITLKSGLNLLQFSWVDTLIDPTSIHLDVADTDIGVEVQSAIYPPKLSNTIQWYVKSENAGEKKLEVSYFTSGLTWSANYIAIMDKSEEKMSLEALVNISNNSGEDYENAHTRLIVGEIQLVEEVRTLAAGRAVEKSAKKAEDRETELRRRARGAAVATTDTAFDLYAAKAPAVAETQTLSEYYMYVLEGRDTIKHEWQKRKLSFVIEDIPVKTVHRFGEHGQRVARFYQFKNDEEHNLGTEPMPEGNVVVFIKDENNTISSYVGQTWIEFTPTGKEVKLYLGPDPEVKVEKKQMSNRRVNLLFDEKNRSLVKFDTEREFTFEIENFKTESVNLEIKENLGRDWQILSSTHDYEKKDANSIEFKLELDADSKETLKYQVRFMGR